MMEPKIHPAAEMFPMMTDVELRDLADDIQKNGLLEPVVLYDGMVLDGRNRLAACKLAGISPGFVEAKGDVKSLTLYVLSKNLHRRHLTESQRATIGAEMMPMLQEEARNRSNANLRHGSESPTWPTGYDGELKGRSVEIAGRALGIGATTVRRAAAVKKVAPELFEKMKKGEVTAFGAENIIRGKKKASDPMTVYHPITPRQKVVAGAQKQRLIVAFCRMTGQCRGLQLVKVPMVVSMCSQDEIRELMGMARNIASQLRAFAGKLDNARGAATADDGGSL
ncbi:MAG TPA: ParB N-terminal domain-containing protein [Terriglobales bacterium]|nr:ParB N-terminal domain-containing protein [Terriglobales bacterium]